MFSNIYSYADAGTSDLFHLTYLSVDQEIANRTFIYKAATDDASDPLLNPAHVLIGKDSKNEKMADKFTQWAISAEGQAIEVTTSLRL
ncbi:hypothetical protein N7532_008278 [Penicillium argentinense]|uniref:PBP domain-containing protein n=1 Tax=Penicillium argentinense TaxID=1131581 RepID=A0A9W9K1G1_9EURO|nr:uncharacterized protein N7532_008278 [Penicillium argentinense]KAJ5089594.1 hypothetical protein N7532_008278 [Penicillium argentinense]